MNKAPVSSISKAGLLTGALLAGLALTALAQSATVWTGPSSNPPSGDVDMPLNTGISNQTKTGGSIQVNGGFGIAGPFIFLPSTPPTAGQVLTAIDAQGTAAWQSKGNAIIAVNQQVATTSIGTTTISISPGRCKNGILITAGLDAFRQDGNNNNNAAAAILHVTDNSVPLPTGDLYFGSTKDGGSGLFWGYWLGGLSKSYYLSGVSSNHVIQASVYGGIATRGTATAQNAFTVTSGILGSIIYVRQAYLNAVCL